MKPNEQPSDEMLDRAIDGIQKEPLEQNVVDASAARVWSRMSEELGAKSVPAIYGCKDFQALIPDYQGGRLSPARALLVKDHLHECIACRKVFMGRSGAAPRPRSRVMLSLPFRWAVAAALALAAGLGGWYMYQQFAPAQAGPAATVVSVNGSLFRPAGEATPALAPGATIQGGVQVRTAKDSNAMLRLRDGSTIEAGARADLSIAETGRDVTIRLARGSVIVEAAKRRAGHLYVSTRDCRVAVRGTVFSVTSGVKGARVSVVEGEVHVSHGGNTKILHAGDQYASAALAQVSVEQEIAWSRKADEHLALLREVKKLSEEMERQVRLPYARYSSALLKYLPQETAVYAALPNFGEALAQSQKILEERLKDSPVLREWWEQKTGTNSGKKPGEIIEEIRMLSTYLGDEIVVAAALEPAGKLGEPVVLAEVKQSGFAEFLKSEINRLGGGTVRIFQSAAAITPGAGKELLVYTNSNIVAISSGDKLLRPVAAAIEGQGTGSLTGTPFHSQIMAAYRDGAGLLVCADLQRIMPNSRAGDELLGNVGSVVVSQKTAGGKPNTQAIVTFRGERTGVGAWLASPSPIGALDFISPDATVVWAVIAKDLPRVIDDLVAKLPQASNDIAKAEKELGISIRNDLAAALGGELAFAFDGPAVPIPAWKAVAEVNNPGTFQSTLQTLVNSLSHMAVKEGKPPIRLSQEVAGGRTYFTISSEAFKPLSQVHYVFVDSYLVVAPSRALLDKALQNRTAGNVLTNSPKFTALLPRDAQPNFSAMVYHNLSTGIGMVSGALNPEKQKALAELARPTVILAYASSDRITLASAGEAFGITPGNLFGLRTPLGFAALR
jgi:hypothetical protein